MEAGTLNATYRPGTGKSFVRKLRQAGKIPAICYGKGEEPILLAIDPTELLKSLDPEKRANTLINLKVEGAGPPAQTVTVMLRDYQRDILRGNVVHADFIRVKMDEDVTAVVPLVMVGKPEGVKLGGTLHLVFRTLAIACTP